MLENFLEETVEFLVQKGIKKEDIKFIGDREGKFHCSWSEFEKMADFEYDSGYGGAEIPGDLVIVLNTGEYIERGEYNGSEWWELKRPPVLSPDAKKLQKIRDPEGLGRELWLLNAVK